MSVMRSRDLARCSDEELLRIGSKDVQALGVFYDRYEDPLLVFFRRASGRADLAADLTAEVFAAALGSLDQFRPELGSARAWLFGIARHQLAQTWRRRRVEAQARKRMGMEPIMLSDEDLQRIDELASSTDSLRLLEDLPGDQRTAVVGRVLEERDYAELAVELECSEMVVRQRVSRGLRALRSRLGGAQ
jgi:RNA polymerase sigma factor (sigma-70 family)